MATPFGVDSLTSRLDLFDWTAFIQWNGGFAPAFAGRNFLGGDFLWVGAEATDTLSNPQPDELDNLNIQVAMIAPIQGSGSPAVRQQKSGDLGVLYGQIDGDAICGRLAAALNTGELLLKSSQLVNVYLQVDPSVAFSADYWAGWADTVTKQAVTIKQSNGQSVTLHPFRPCIMCAFAQSGATLAIDPHVTVALQASTAQQPALSSQCWGFWADAADLDPSLQRPNAQIDFTKFAPTPAPIWVWRFAKTLLDAAGNPIANPALPIAADQTNIAGSPNHFGWEYMLDAGKWQPSGKVVNHGFSFGGALTAAKIATISQSQVPEESRFEQRCNSLTHVLGDFMTVLGLYARPPTAALTMSATSSMNPTAVSAVRNTTLNLFTAFEQPVGATVDTYYDAAAHHGTTDANNALPYVAEILFQPPHSTVFFVFDWSPPGSLAGANTEPTTPADLTAADSARITTYISDVVAAYQNYLTTHPNRPYRIGFYGAGVELRVAYGTGGVSGFWQSASACRASNAPPNWPWPHATRWQPFPSPPFQPNIAGLAGEDLDYDWGDGGDWFPFSQFNVALTRIETNTTPALFATAQRIFGYLIIPPNP
ncbi:hypothetical protein [Rhodoblastus sp.]|uniref:hypothetical protein n=1 Tax=Rhodoblastus sp. TaxID=1962975 RepID=UPI003F96DC8E